MRFDFKNTSGSVSQTSQHSSVLPYPSNYSMSSFLVMKEPYLYLNANNTPHLEKINAREKRFRRLFQSDFKTNIRVSDRYS